MGTIFIILGLLIFCAHLFAAFFRKSRIPDVLFLVMIGILIGPVLGLVTPDMFGNAGSLLASLTLVFILFDSGIDMHVNDLRHYWSGVVQVTFFSFLLSIVVTALISHYVADLEWTTSILLGSMVAGTGASIVIPIIRQMKISSRTQVVLTLESAISGVLCIVVALAMMEGFKMGKISLLKITGSVLVSFIIALAIGLLGGVIWSGLLNRVRKLNNSIFLTPAFVFVVYGISEALGYSGAISALAFGIVLGNTIYFEYSVLRPLLHRNAGLHPLVPKMNPLMDIEKSFFKEMVFILKTYFFVYIGISIPFTDTLALLYGFLIAAAIFSVRFLLIMIVGRENSQTDRLIVSIMAPKGLVSAVLASMPQQINNAASSDIIPGAERLECMAYSVIFFSILICSLLVLSMRKKIIDNDYKPEQVEVYDYE